MNTKVIIALFIALIAVIFFSSLQSVHKKQAESAVPVTQATPSPQAATSTPQPTLEPTATLAPVQHSGFRVNVRGDDD